MSMMSERFITTCDICKREMSTTEANAHQYTKGWVKSRTGGGGHGVSLPERENRWAHGGCVDKAVSGMLGQAGLFDNKPAPPEPPRPTNAHYDESGRFIHDSCAVCGKDAPFGVDVFLTKGHLGMWYCREHKPNDRSERPAAAAS